MVPSILTGIPQSTQIEQYISEQVSKSGEELRASTWPFPTIFQHFLTITAG